jgi:hypothetical protein
METSPEHWRDLQRRRLCTGRLRLGLGSTRVAPASSTQGTSRSSSACRVIANVQGTSTKEDIGVAEPHAHPAHTQRDRTRSRSSVLANGPLCRPSEVATGAEVVAGGGRGVAGRQPLQSGLATGSTTSLGPVNALTRKACSFAVCGSNNRNDKAVGGTIGGRLGRGRGGAGQACDKRPKGTWL